MEANKTNSAIFTAKIHALPWAHSSRTAKEDEMLLFRTYTNCALFYNVTRRLHGRICGMRKQLTQIVQLQ